MLPWAAVVFAKWPEPGRVKTRLHGLLTPQRAAELHLACIADTIAKISLVPGCRKWLRVAATPARALELHRQLDLSSRWRIGTQRGRDLGARLEDAFQSAFRSGFRRVMVVGTDTPWMETSLVLRAFQMMRVADTVIGPTLDGGYYLVAARKLIPGMFRSIPWGTRHVLDRTLAAIRKAHASFRLLHRDFDLDRPADFERARELLRENEKRAPRLAHWMKTWEADAAIESNHPPAPRPQSRRPLLVRR